MGDRRQLTGDKYGSVTRRCEEGDKRLGGLGLVNTCVGRTARQPIFTTGYDTYRDFADGAQLSALQQTHRADIGHMALRVGSKAP